VGLRVAVPDDSGDARAFTQWSEQPGSTSFNDDVDPKYNHEQQ